MVHCIRRSRPLYIYVVEPGWGIVDYQSRSKIKMAAKNMIRAAVAIVVLLAIGEESSASVIHKTIESDDGDTIDCVAISLEIQQTWPSVYGDSRPRLFVYYTNDSGVHHNCFNTECGGFQITNNKYSLGTAWTGESFLGGHQYGVSIGIHRDNAKLIWWVSVMDVDIGYYHDSVFDTRFPEGHYVEMGGRVLNTRQGGTHTTTPMGSSMPECASTLYTASIRDYLGVSGLGQLFEDEVDRNVATVPSCYGARKVGFAKKRPGYQTAYGGAGGIYCDQ